MSDGCQPPRYYPFTASWARHAAFIGLLLLASCVISDSDDLHTTVRISFTGEDGLTIWIDLSRSVTLPLDEDDATFIMEESDCSCRGNLEFVNDYWQYEGPDCTIRIQADTGDVECSFD